MINHDADDLPPGLWPHCERCLQLGEDVGLMPVESDNTGGTMRYDIPSCSEACFAMRTLADANTLIDLYRNGHL